MCNKRGCLVGIVVLFVGAIASANIVTNPGYESGFTGWSGGTGIAETGYARSGSYSGRIDGPGVIAQLPVGGWTAIKTGDIVDVSVWVLNPSTDPLTVAQAARIEVLIYGAGETTVTYSDTWSMYGGMAEDTWIKASLTPFVVPFGSAGHYEYFKIVYHNYGAASGSVYLDDWDVTVVPEPATIAMFCLGGLLAMRRRRKA